MANKHFATHCVYILQDTQENQFYVGSHNAKRHHYTETGILSQSGNPLQKIAVQTKNWNSYYDRVKLLYVIQCDSEETALGIEQQLINLMFILFPAERIMNKRRTANNPSHYYSYPHTAEWKKNYSEVMRKPKSVNSLKGKREVK